MICNDRSAILFVGAATEVEALKKALAEAKEKAAKEQAAWYVSNVSIIFDCSMLLYYLFWMFYMHYYAIFYYFGLTY